MGSAPMIIYVIKRLISSFTVLLLVLSLCFFLLRILPGGPFDEEKALPKSVQAKIESAYGLNLPLNQQYILFLKDFFKGELGYSYKYEGQPIAEIIQTALPTTLQLGLMTLLLSFLIGVPLGVWAAANAGRTMDHVVMSLAMGGISLPSFFIAPILIHVFSFGWPLSNWSPGFTEYLSQSGILLPSALWMGPRFYLLPVLTLSIRPIALIARLTRSSLLDVLQNDFIRTARSKGVSEGKVLYKHVLLNALNPLLTYSGPLIAGILSGSFVVETLFAIPGIGKFMIQGVLFRDYPLVMAMTLLFSVILICANFLVDILYHLIDPRIEKV